MVEEDGKKHEDQQEEEEVPGFVWSYEDPRFLRKLSVEKLLFTTDN
jgi:hypothetical protein